MKYVVTYEIIIFNLLVGKTTKKGKKKKTKRVYHNGETNYLVLKYYFLKKQPGYDREDDKFRSEILKPNRFQTFSP